MLTLSSASIPLQVSLKVALALQENTDFVSFLPVEVLFLVAEQLSTRDICNVLQVCSQWSQYFGKSVSMLAPRGLAGLSVPKRFPDICQLDLGRTADRLLTEELTQLRQLTHLRTISLQGCSSITSLHFLKGLTGKTNLNSCVPVVD